MRNKILVLGITGSFASGKTTVAGMFKRLGAYCIDADKIYHGLIRPGGLLYERIVSAFGCEILKSNRQIDRKKLGKIIFSEGQNLKRLIRITHPAIIKKIKIELSRVRKTKREKIIVIDAPLLIEAGLIKIVDKLVVVKIAKINRIARVRKIRGLSTGEVMKRIKAQLSQEEKIKLADYVIDNNGTLQQTRNQVRDIWKKIRNGG